jgi:NAD(P)-dependent dehydrogenase (short-subunit alcohol dehydrogenase family)
MEYDLAGKTFVATGATSGIGLAAAGLLIRRGAAVIGIGRSTERCAAAEEALNATTEKPLARYLVADLSVQAEVRQLAQSIRSTTDTLDGLINNAGVFTYWLAFTPEGFEIQWAVNHLAPFLLTHELLPVLRRAPQGRVVTVSSGSHYHTRLRWDDIQLRRRYNCLLAYKQTKLCNVLFTAELRRRLGTETNVRAFAADPGLVKTDMGFKQTPALARWIWDRRRRGGISPEESAEGVVFLASEPSIQDASEVYWKHGKPKPPNPYALDEAAAGRLWELSSRMCGIAPGTYGQEQKDG